MRLWLLLNLAFALIAATPTPTLSIKGRWERFMLIRIETTNTGCALTEVWYDQFVGEVSN